MLSSAETSGLSVEHIFSDTANNIDIGAISLKTYNSYCLRMIRMALT